ncbi:hypothetical protein C0J52_08502 [Blattella germanica]|nr:hypothetical protein C0J52_08502 [Blattella germanica]
MASRQPKCQYCFARKELIGNNRILWTDKKKHDSCLKRIKLAALETVNLLNYLNNFTKKINNNVNLVKNINSSLNLMTSTNAILYFMTETRNPRDAYFIYDLMMFTLSRTFMVEEKMSNLVLLINDFLEMTEVLVFAMIELFATISPSPEDNDLITNLTTFKNLTINNMLTELRRVKEIITKESVSVVDLFSNLHTNIPPPDSRTLNSTALMFEYYNDLWHLRRKIQQERSYQRRVIMS